MFENITKVNSFVNSVVWGIPMLLLITGTGLFLTIRTRGIQFRKFGTTFRYIFGGLGKNKSLEKGSVTPFQALTTAVSATVGTGNISGITFAITLGGPGSLFWLWISALIGMCTKFSEIVLSVKFREQNAKGDWVGGPMYYIKNGLGENWRFLALLFSVFGMFASFGIGNAVQAGTITVSVNTAISAFFPSMSSPDNVGKINLILGIALAVMVGVVLLGGIKRIGQVTEMLVPLMSMLYIAACLVVLIVNYKNIFPVFVLIFKCAFKPQAIIGGTAGLAIKQSMLWGFKRGVFSNEAGLGSAPIAYAATSETDPVKQGYYGIFEVFMDTIIICTLTGLSLLVSGIDLNYGVMGTTALNASALGTVFGAKFGSLLIAVSICLFAFSTILSWGLYGTRCAEYLFGSRIIKIYQLIYVLIVLVGSTMSLQLAWDISDTLNGLMAIPNLVALVGLSGVIVRFIGMSREERL